MGPESMKKAMKKHGRGENVTGFVACEDATMHPRVA